MIKVSPEHRALLKHLQKERDEYAFALGVATAEFEDAKRMFFERLNISKERQARIGKDILQSLGLDSSKADYTIYLYGITPGAREEDDGAVKQLVAGEYVDVEG